MLTTTRPTPSSSTDNACADAPARSAGRSLCATHNPRDTVMAFYDAFDRGALDRLDSIDPRFEARVFGATVLDWSGFLGFATAFRDGFPNGNHVFDHVVTEGDKVATIGRYSGRHERAFMGVPATGRAVDFVVMHIDIVDRGRIVEHRGIGDINAMWNQLGVRPPAST